MRVKAEEKFAYLTDIRGIASIVVLLSHIIQIFLLRHEELPIAVHKLSSFLSTYAVVVFFVLSGFLIAHSIEENTKRNNGILDVKKYIAARFARIYPPFIYAIIVSMCVYIILKVFNLPGIATPLKLPGDIYSAREFIKISASEFALSLMMIQGLLDINGPLWSLYIEVKLYFIFMCFHLIFVRRYSIVSIGALIVITYLSLRFNPEFLRYSAIWLAGCITYYLYADKSGSLWKSALACICLVALIMCYDILVRLSIFPLVFQSSRLILFDIAIAFAISGMILIFRFRLPFANEVGVFSYSLYVTHFPVLLLIQSLLIELGNKSLFIDILVSILAFFVALIIGKAGGVVEATKLKFQAIIIEILKDASRVFKF